MSAMRPGVARGLVALALVALTAASVDARTWSWLGVRIRELTEPEMDELAKSHGIGEGFGVLIVEVMADTPAARAGIRNGDIVVAFDGRPITETRLLQRLVARSPVDQDIRLTVLRREGRLPVPVRLMAMPRPVAGERVAAEFGFVLREAEAEGAAPQPVTTTPAVTVVIRGTAAEKAGLEVGDVILEVNEQSVKTRDAAREVLSEVALDRPLRLGVQRDGRRVSLTLAAPEDRSRP